MHSPALTPVRIAEGDGRNLGCHGNARCQRAEWIWRHAMAGGADIMLFGSGNFAGRIALDIAASARSPVQVCIAGRNAARVDWLRVAGNARAAIFGTPARFTAAQADLAAG